MKVISDTPRRWLVASACVLARNGAARNNLSHGRPRSYSFVPRQIQCSGTTRQVENKPKLLSVPTMHRFPQGASKVTFV